MSGRGDDICSNDNNSIFRVCIAIWTDESLRSDSDNEYDE